MIFVFGVNSGFSTIFIASVNVWNMEQLHQGFHFLENHEMSWNFVLARMSGNCPGILIYVREFSQKMAMPISTVVFHFAASVGRQDHYDLSG